MFSPADYSYYPTSTNRGYFGGLGVLASDKYFPNRVSIEVPLECINYLSCLYRNACSILECVTDSNPLY